MSAYLDSMDKMETAIRALSGVGALLCPDGDLDAGARDDVTLLIRLLVEQLTTASDGLHEVFKLMKDFAPHAMEMSEGAAQERNGGGQ